jgi:NAD(P)-dependent dehydrogenase (short-subunit alcohol dehydrogenase family)
MAQSFSGSRFLVTGAARGVGLAVCQSARAAGAHVIGVDINDIPSGVADVGLKGDLGDADFCKRIVAESGHVDVLVNAAGLLRPQNLLEMSVEDFDKAVAVNLRSVFQLCQGVIPSMLDKGKGRIINFSSVVARTGGTTSAAYAAAKAGVITFTKSIAKEYAKKGITANSIAPAAIDTELNSFLTPEGRAKLENDIPVGRFSTPQEFADIVMFMASDSAGFITGATLDVNGGWVMV